MTITTYRLRDDVCAACGGDGREQVALEDHYPLVTCTVCEGDGQPRQCAFHNGMRSICTRTATRRRWGGLLVCERHHAAAERERRREV